jgi:hypothetical protein
LVRQIPALFFRFYNEIDAMPVGFILSIACIAFSPALLFFDGALAQAAFTSLFVVALAMAARDLRAEQLEHLQPTLSRVISLALLPAIWMLLQLLPLGIFGFGHPIWESASLALGSSLTASLSVDPGATLLALWRYLAMVALALTVVILAVDRRKAEWTLFALLIVSTIVALYVLARSDIKFSSSLNSTSMIVALGCLAGAATTIRAYERSETRSQGSSWSTFISAAPGIFMGTAGIVLCALALLRIASGYMIIATILGLTVFAALALIRRLGFGLWGIMAIGIALAAIVFAVFAQVEIIRPSNPLLAFVNPANDARIAVTSRILMDTRWSGSGAGTFAVVAELYRDIDEGSTTAASTAAAIAIELGRPALLVVGLSVVYLAIILLRATISRGRDSFFSALGVAAIVFLSVTAFGDNGLLRPAVAILIAAIVGLAISQSVGRHAQR